MLLVGVEVTLHRNNGDRVSGLPDPNGGAFDAAGDFDSLIGSTDLPMIGSLDSCGYSTLGATIVADWFAAIPRRRDGRPRSAVAAVRIPTVCDVDDRHGSRRVVDPVDDAVGASPGTVTIIEGGVEALADSLRVVQQRPDDELVCGESNSLGQMLRKLTSRRGRDDEGVAGRVVGHARCRRRAFMAWPSCSSDSPSPRSSSASEAARRLSVSGSDKIAMVSSRDSRSSVAMRTAEGLPCTVTVTRSCWEFTRPTSAERCDFTSASDRIVMVISMTIQRS